MVEYSTCARQEVRARQTFFQYDILWSILYILGIFKILISFKFIAVDAFEYWVFSWISKINMENFRKFHIFKIFGKNRIFKKNFKLQIALKIRFLRYNQTKKFATKFYHKFYDSKKKFWRARTSARGARRISHRCENSKIMFFWHRW